VPPTPLIGRERELAELGELLRAGASRLVTLTGHGGVGKTRLALGVAAGAGADFPDGAVFVPLAPVGDPALVVPTVARALGVAEVGGKPPPEALRAHLRDRRLLLVLDNCEQVLDAAPAVAGLLAACAGLAVLATSRAPLRVRGEREYPVRPLACPRSTASRAWMRWRCPPPCGSSSTVPVPRSPAFALTRANAAAVAAICRRLDGLPLAIELAAARARTLTPTELLARLDRALPLLTGGPRDLPERQRTMRAAIAWSHQLLRAPERRLLGRLAVFRGGWDLAAAEAVGAGGDIAGGEILDLLAALVEQSLVVAEGDEGDATRYRLLVPVHEFAEEQLGREEEAEEARRRHAAHYLARAERAEPALRGGGQAAWLARLEREHDNLRAALGRALARGEVAMGLRLGGALWRFWLVRGHYAEGRRWLTAFLALADDTLDPGLRLAGLYADGHLAYRQDDHGAARARFEAGLLLAEAVGDRAQRARLLVQLGHVATETGDHATAERSYRAGLAAWRTLDNPAELGIALGSLGRLAFLRGEPANARGPLEEAVALFRAVGDTLDGCAALLTLGLIACDAGEHAAARAHFAACLVGYTALGDRRGIAVAVAGFAGLAAATAEPVRALRLAAAVASARSATDLPFKVEWRARLDSAGAAARALLAPGPAGLAWAEGEALSLEEAAAYALADDATGAS
jgi:non-specific serine/threonine protein kinase